MDAYDVAPDGSWFLVIKHKTPAVASTPTFVRVVDNWFEELRQLLPAGR